MGRWGWRRAKGELVRPNAADTLRSTATCFCPYFVEGLIGILAAICPWPAASSRRPPPFPATPMSLTRVHHYRPSAAAAATAAVANTLAEPLLPTGFVHQTIDALVYPKSSRAPSPSVQAIGDGRRRHHPRHGLRRLRRPCRDRHHRSHYAAGRRCDSITRTPTQQKDLRAKPRERRRSQSA